MFFSLHFIAFKGFISRQNKIRNLERRIGRLKRDIEWAEEIGYTSHSERLKKDMDEAILELEKLTSAKTDR